MTQVFEVYPLTTEKLLAVFKGANSKRRGMGGEEKEEDGKGEGKKGWQEREGERKGTRALKIRDKTSYEKYSQQMTSHIGTESWRSSKTYARTRL